MKNPRLLLPLRVPELGPALGKLVGGTARNGTWISLDAVRYRMATRIIQSAGEARRLAASDERSAALAAIGSATWQEAWEEAVAEVAELAADRITVQLEAEARAVGMGRRRRARLRLGEVERRALAARLGSAGVDLVAALDTVEHHASRARDATGLDRDAVEQWQESLRYAARQLEAAWLSLEEAVAREGTRWHAAADRVAAWRKPAWPIVVFGVPVMAVATWLGLVFGGYLPPPSWLVRVWTALFGS